MFDKFMKRLRRVILTICANFNTQRNIILIIDNIPEVASKPIDNFSFFEYLQRNKEHGFFSYYFINKNCVGANEIKKKYGKYVVTVGNMHGFLLFTKIALLLTKTKFVCDSFQSFQHMNIGMMEAIKASPYIYSVFTQHGINFFKEDIVTAKTYGKYIFDKVMISNEYERGIFLERGKFQENDFINNGLFRWDAFCTKPNDENIIFCFFTYRRYLSEIDDLENSVYVRTIKSLLNNETLHRIINANGLKLKVALHHSLVDKFGYEFLKGVQIVDDSEIADMKMKARMLITDYSSMCFEFMLQNKPVIFYKISDEAECLKYKHSADIAYPYKDRDDKIFNIVASEREFENLFADIIRNNFQLNTEQQSKSDLFFYYKNQFSERFLYALMTLKECTKRLYYIPVEKKIKFCDWMDIKTYGIATVEKWGRWAEKKKYKLGFVTDYTDTDLEIILGVRASVNEKQKYIDVLCYVNGKYTKTLHLCSPKRQEFKLLIPKRIVKINRLIELKFIVSDIKSPKMLGVSEDTRLLSLGFIDMLLQKKVED